MVPDGRVLITYKNIFFTFDKKVFAIQKYYKNIDLDFYLQFLLLPVTMYIHRNFTQVKDYGLSYPYIHHFIYWYLTRKTKSDKIFKKYFI